MIWMLHPPDPDLLLEELKRLNELKLTECFKNNFTFIELKRTQNTPQIMPPESKKKKVDTNAELENTSVDFNTLNYTKESFNKYNIGDEFERESGFSGYISKSDSSQNDFSQ